MKNCCNHSKKDNKCIRKSDKKTFKLPRRFSRKKCRKPKGFTMRSSCAPYKDCFKKSKKGGGKKLTELGKQWAEAASKDMEKRINSQNGDKKDFLFNPKNPKKSFDVYIDKNPKDTIPIKYKKIKDVKNTIKKLERLYKNGKYSHKRIWQVAMIMKVRLEVLKDKKKTHYKLAKKYLDFLGDRTKIINDKSRKKLTIKL